MKILTERAGRIVNAAKLKKASGRKGTGQFLVEGINSVEAAVEAGCAQDIFVEQSLLDSDSPQLAGRDLVGFLANARSQRVFVHAIDDKAAAKLADTVTSPGIFAVCDSHRVVGDIGSLGENIEQSQLVAVAVNTADPGNAGTLIRLADAMGAGAVIFAGDSVDPLNGKVVRASAGSLFHLPVIRESAMDTVLKTLRDGGLNLLATAANGEIDITDFKQAGRILSQPTAWLFGNEAHGLGEELLEQADFRVSIPIRGHAESLNLATAAAICLYESSRHLY